MQRQILKCTMNSDKSPVNRYHVCAGLGRVPPFRAFMDFPNLADRGRRDDRQSNPPIQRCDTSLAATGLQKFGGLAYMGTTVCSPSRTGAMREWLGFRS